MSSVSFGHISFLELLNFKSYKGYRKIGPFRNFTAVIGPNGSGKSNLMDAISFVLGIRTEQLRGKLRELLHNDGSCEEAKEGYVEIVYEDETENVRFRRSITTSRGSGGSFTSEYSIDGEVTTMELYLRRLSSLGVLVKARNFLVFQGDIESVAAMHSKELTRMVECVSGSVSFAKEYDRLLTEKEKTETMMMQLHGRKRNLLIEKKQKKEQMAEAEKHRSIEECLQTERLRYFAWKVYSLEFEISAGQEGIRRLEEEVEEERRCRLVSQQRVASKKEELIKLGQTVQEMEEKIQLKCRAVEDSEPGLIRVFEEVGRLEKKQVLTRSKLSEKDRRLEMWKRNVGKLEGDVKELESAQRRFEEMMEEESGGVRLNEQDLVQYHQINNRIITLTGRLQQEKNAVDAALLTLIEALDRHRARADQVAAQNCQLQQTVGVLKARMEQEMVEKEEVERQLIEKKTRKKQLEKSARQEATKRDKLALEMEEVRRQIAEGKASRRESRRDSKIAETISRMKGVIPGVFGRITDLGRVRQSRYNLAMAVVLGSDLDSVLVDSKQTAVQCIQFLKENRCFALNFLPLDSIQSKSINEELRQLSGSAKLALDLLDFDQRFHNGFMAVCGNAIICETLEEAKHLAFQVKVGVKVVALNGTLIHKTGYITGGLSETMESRAARWDDDKLNDLRAKKVKLEAEMGGIPTVRDSQMEEMKLQAEIQQIESRQSSRENELQSTQQSLDEKYLQINRSEKDEERLHEEIKATEVEISERQTALDKIKSQIDVIADREFRDFSSQIGVGNYREYEERHLQKAKETGEKRRKFEVQIGHLKAQLDYEKSRDLQQPISELQERLQLEITKVQTLRSEAEISQKSQARMKTEIEVMEGSYEEMKASLKMMEIGLKEIKELDEARLHTMREKESALNSRKASEFHHLDQKSEIFQRTSMEFGGEVIPDFDLLSTEMIAEEVLGNVELKSKMDEELRERIEELNFSLNRSAPNLKAFDQFDHLKAQENEEMSRFEEARKQEQKISRAFQEVHSKRYRAFMEAFNFISKEIDQIYKDLTKSEDHPYGGSAALYLESEEIPFFHGIKFSAIPPAKRYRDMEQLSGGEKTVIALSLLFAIHSYKPCPFFVLDEIDASLDAVNVDRVVDYIKKRTREKEGHFQSIVISLKDAFFHKADCLIGVTRDLQQGGSEVLTLDLEAFEQANNL